jgi:FkbM family methyltransferase
MHRIERFCLAIRHSSCLSQAGWLWDRIRPQYDRVVGLLGRRGLERTINGADRILVLPQFRHLTESYEPDVWGAIMVQVRPGDVVADIGAFVGLYTIAAGSASAFEPDPGSFAALNAHVALNGIGGRVELVQAAVGSEDGAVPFISGRATESGVGGDRDDARHRVRCVRLDSILSDRRVDVMKVDVEGYEAQVLEGGLRLLEDARRCPRAIYLEVHLHPYAWPACGVNEGSLLDLLSGSGYAAFDLEGRAVESVERWGEIIARPARR